MIEHVRTEGVFSLEGEDFDVENNVWIVGDAEEVLVIDAAHDAAPIAEAVGDRRVAAIVATHGHNDHLNAAFDLASRVGGAPVLLHEADRMLFHEVYPDAEPDGTLSEGQILRAGPVALSVLHTPGHSPGGCCLYDEEARVLFSGDSLFAGGPGATGRRYSDFSLLIESLSAKVLVLPGETRVLPGHGEETTIATEAPMLDSWVARGY